MQITPDIFAYIALFGWPLVSIVLYRTMTFLNATLITILAAQLLLPSAFAIKIPMIPQFDKDTIPSVCVFVAFILGRSRKVGFRRGFGLVEILIGASVVAPICTSVLNGDPIASGTMILPGVGIYDGLSASIFQAVVLMPLIYGRLAVTRGADVTEVLRLLVFAGLAYSLPLLYEIRFSPQLHAWVYGYYPSDFIQVIREGGAFRPMVFFAHGLLASFFVMTAVVSSAALWRMKMRTGRIPQAVPTLYLGAVLALCRSGAALTYGVFAAPLVLWAGPKAQARVAMILALVALTYPVARIWGIFPTDTIVSAAEALSAERASSLKFRFDEDQALLDKAMQRPLFGWGRYGRNRIYGQNWQGDDADLTVSDGRWIITFGQFGAVGFLLEFGLLAFPVFRAFAAIKKATSYLERVSIAAVALLVGINMVELLPNSTLSPWSWLVDGCLLGCCELVIARSQLRRPREGFFLATEAVAAE
jgi:hypothetical protein